MTRRMVTMLTRICWHVSCFVHTHDNIILSSRGRKRDVVGSGKKKQKKPSLLRSRFLLLFTHLSISVCYNTASIRILWKYINGYRLYSVYVHVL